MNCGSCTFFADGQNECRRYAPSPAEGSNKAHWPSVAADDWCGEFVASDQGRKVA